MKSSLENFEADLAALPSRVGERNRRLFALAFKGRAAGFSADEVTQRIVASSGEPPLGVSEVERAVRKVYAQPEAKRPAVQPKPTDWKPRYHLEKRRGNPVLSNVLGKQPGASVRQPQAPAATAPLGIVRELIELGGGEASSADLMACSPLPIRSEPEWQALDFCMALDEPDSRFFFLGELRQKRTRERLHELCEIEASLAFGDEVTLPTHLMPNDLTGEPAKNEKGEESYALEACLAHRRYAVVEFDAMPLRVQAAFWLGGDSVGPPADPFACLFRRQVDSRTPAPERRPAVRRAAEAPGEGPGGRSRSGVSL